MSGRDYLHFQTDGSQFNITIISYWWYPWYWIILSAMYYPLGILLIWTTQIEHVHNYSLYSIHNYHYLQAQINGPHQ